MSEVLSQTGDPSDDKNNQRKPRTRRLMQILGLLLIVLSVLLAWYLIVAYIGWQNGQTIRMEQQEQELSEHLARQMSLAREDIQQGSYSLALRRLEWVLERVPDYEEAQRLKEQVEAALDASLTPESDVAGIATRTPSPTVTPGLVEDPQSELQRLRDLIAAESWEKAVSGLVAFQRQFPSYERQQTDEMLYEAYVNLGLELVNGERVELGLFYLERAETLGDLSQSAQDYRTWANLYVQGMAFYGVNWQTTASYFRDLCVAAPFYQSSCDELYNVLILQGDQYSAAQDWCPAQTLYEEATQYGRSQTLTDKLSQAREGCAAATPTPSTPLDSTVPVTETAGTPFTSPVSTDIPATP
jgi:tetratricopeptide (TPR) repeat protein